MRLPTNESIAQALDGLNDGDENRFMSKTFVQHTWIYMILHP